MLMASNDGYAPYMGVSLFSMLENNAEDFDRIHIYIIDNGISEGNREKLLAQAAAYPHVVTTFHDLGDSFSAFQPKVDNGWDNTIYGRFFIDQIIEEGVEKALYVDGDTIVNGSLRELMSTDLGENCMAGVRDALETQRIAYLNMGETARYINSGVLLIDLKNYREFEVRKRIIRFVNTFDKRLDYPDQDAISAVCGNKIQILPPKYNFGWYLPERRLKWDYYKANFPYSYEELYETVKDNYADVVIFHYFGVGKPWRRGECAPEFKRVWVSYSKRSIWKLKPRFAGKAQMLKYYLITKPKRWLLKQIMHLLGMERYNKICDFYERHWGMNLVKKNSKGRIAQ